MSVDEMRPSSGVALSSSRRSEAEITLRSSYHLVQLRQLDRRGGEDRLQILVGEEHARADEEVAAREQPVRRGVADRPVDDVVHAGAREEVIERLDAQGSA